MTNAEEHSQESILREQSVVLALCERCCRWMNGAVAIRLAQAVASGGTTDAEWLQSQLAQLETGRIRHWELELERLASIGVDVVTIAERNYPTNLALTHDAPPALFVRGSIEDRDRRSMAIVGTRKATEAGLTMASWLARELSKQGITIVSGLAKGIDTAAHAGALTARGRTIAVAGTDVETVYPSANQRLARSVERSGAYVSQFLPGYPPSRWGFPVRNVTMSGMSLGTIVVEASETSGAKIQAEAALAHGKHLFLVEDLVTAQPWAKRLEGDPSVTVSSDPGEIIAAAESLVSPFGGVLI